MPYQIDIKITNQDGQIAVLSQAFTFSQAPLLASVAPSSGPEAGGTSVTLSGQFFQPGAAVEFGGRSASNVVVAPDGLSLTCITPDMR